MHTMSASSPIPLFDRFHIAASDPVGVRLTPAEALQLSLQLDLTRLFNVRNSMTIADFLTGTPTSLDYGLPDTLTLSAQSATDLQRWELVILRAIALYEPRLIQVRVAVGPDRFRPTLARVTIMALAAVGRELCQFHFDSSLDDRNVRAGVPA
jgi:type VI secretion system protein ImpF